MQASYERIWAAPVNFKRPNSSVLETPVEKTLFMIAKKEMKNLSTKLLKQYTHLPT